MPTVFYCGAIAVAVIHFAYAAYLLIGYFATLIGWQRGWEWTRNFWFRASHAIMIFVVVLRVWFGGTCPLTLLEKYMRQRAGMASYDGEFIRHYLQEWFQLSSATSSYHLLYTLFFCSVISLFYLWPPRQREGILTQLIGIRPSHQVAQLRSSSQRR